MKALLVLAPALYAAPLLAQQINPPRPASGHTTQTALPVSGYGAAGRIPGYYRYGAGGVELARRSRWRYADAEYDSDVTVGLRLGAGRQQPYPGAVVPVPSRLLWGLNPYVAVDGRYFGAGLGVWIGQLGQYRAEGRKAGRVVPQMRARGGQLNGWHGQLSYADAFSGLGNPPLLLGGAYGGLLGGRLRLGAGAAIPTLALPGQELGLYTEGSVRLAAVEAGVHVQPPLSPAAPGRVAIQVSWFGKAARN